MDSTWLALVAAISGAFIAALASWLVARYQASRRRQTEILFAQKSAYVDLLESSQELFEEIRLTYREHLEQSGGLLDEPCLRIRKISTTPCRRAVDEIRILGHEDSVRLAENLLSHLRGSRLVEGKFDPQEVKDWVKNYWILRQNLIVGVRQDLGLGNGPVELTWRDTSQS